MKPNPESSPQPAPPVEPDPQAAASDASHPSYSSPSSPSSHPGSASSGRRRTGKVASLPKDTRDQVNLMLQDGVPYAAIIEKLEKVSPPLPYALTENNISEWKKGGYEDWLKQHAWVADTRARQEAGLELMRDFDATRVNHAALQLGTLHIFEALRDLGPGSLDQKLGGDSAAFARLLNALSRASRETLHVQKYQDAIANARNMLQNILDPKRKLTEEETRAIVLSVDDILGLRSREAPQSAAPRH